MTPKQIEKRREELRLTLHQAGYDWTKADGIYRIYEDLRIAGEIDAADVLYSLPFARAAAYFADLTAEEIASLALDGLMVPRKKGGRS